MGFISWLSLKKRDKTDHVTDQGALSLSKNKIVSHLNQILLNLNYDLDRYSYLMVQIDDWTLLHERHGKIALSEILSCSAQRIRELADCDHVVCIWDEGQYAAICVLVNLNDPDAIIQLGLKIQKAICAPVMIGEARLYVTCSIGFCPVDSLAERTAEKLFEGASIASDEAAQKGPMAIRAYSSNIPSHKTESSRLGETVEKALYCDQIIAYFQPQVNLLTGELVGFESLARWQHPERGILLPGEFIPQIESAGLSEQFGDVMLHHVLRALIAWDLAGCHVPKVGVNFSAQELCQPHLVERLQWKLDLFDIRPERLSIEVLENVIADVGNDVIVRNIAALARLGFGIDLDDFGAGHASITNIRRFAVRRLKIDRSYVTHLDQDIEQQKFVVAILSLAERLGLETLAEGVETEAEYEILAQLGCLYGQGFGIARPMSFEQTLEWLPEQRKKWSQRGPKLGIVKNN